MKRARVLLKRSESYAIHALIDICEHPSTSAAEIARRLHVPPAYLAKVLKRLVDASYIESHVGRSGGVELRLGVRDLSLLEVLETLSGPLMLDACQSTSPCAARGSAGSCKLGGAWSDITLRVRSLLDEVTFAQICNNPPVALEQARPDQEGAQPERGSTSS